MVITGQSFLLQKTLKTTKTLKNTLKIPQKKFVQVSVLEKILI